MGSYFCVGLLVLNYVMKYQGDGDNDNDGILAAQMIYGLIVGLTSAMVVGSPWIVSFYLKDLVLKIKDCLYLSGIAYVFGWCFLQLLLQKPVNSMPISLLLVQILATICCGSDRGLDFKQWVEVGFQISIFAFKVFFIVIKLNIYVFLIIRLVLYIIWEWRAILVLETPIR